MPSPIGHALMGVATAWAVDLVPGSRNWRAAPSSASWYERAGGGVTLLCAALAVAPDLDLLFRGHRTVSHSIGAVILVGACGMPIATVTSRPVIRLALMCAGAYASHLVLDWLGTDASQPTGIQAFWPLTDRWYISNLDLFAPAERRLFFSWP